MNIDKAGKVQHPRVQLAIHGAIQRGEMKVIHGIIVHQTGAPTAQSSFNSYKTANPNGAHFLIDKDGTIYQTASIYQKTHHVGFIKSRCMEEHKCAPAEVAALKGKTVGRQIGMVEKQKPFPQRYPDNNDSIGIEIVSGVQGQTFEAVTRDGPTAGVADMAGGGAHIHTGDFDARDLPASPGVLEERNRSEYGAMVKRHARLFAVACLVAALPSAHAADSWMRAQVEALPVFVRQVLPCGQWQEAGRQGTYRVVEANVHEGAGSELYVQWMTDPLQGEASRTTKTLAVSELNDDHRQYRFDSLQCRSRGAAIEITVKARYEHDEDDRLHTFTVCVEPGGSYRVTETGARRSRK